MKVDVNADMGESFGRYNLGNDEALMKYITSANVATSFHAGDPLVMEKTVVLAKKYNVAVGAHVGLPDRQGFGRRMMDITKEELRSDTLYQLGALDGILKVYEMTMQHIKPHGILYRMVSENKNYIDTFLNTVKEYDPNLFIMLPPNTPAFERGIQLGLKMAGEALIDLSYDDEGNWIIERNKAARSAEEVAGRALSVAKEKKIATISGKMIGINAVTVCIHGDAPDAEKEAKCVRETLEANGVTPANLNEL